MILTRANVEVELIDRCGTLLNLVGKDGTTVSGSNSALNGPIREGLASLGLAPAAFQVADSDIAAVADAQQSQLFDVAELRTLRNILQAYTKVDQKVGLGEQKLSQIRTDVLKRTEDLTQSCRDQYGYGLGSISTSVLDLAFTENDPNAVEPLWPFTGG